MLWWGFNHKQVKEVGLAIRLVIELVVEASSQLGLLFARMILRLGTGKTV